MVFTAFALQFPAAGASMADKKADAKTPKEPQSYGSEKDWLTGKTGQTVENTPERTSRHDEEFYESRHESEESPAPLGGKSSPQHSDPSPRKAVDNASTPVTGTGTTKVSDAAAGDRKSFFKKRDYRRS
jgi:hypothetical protein